MTLSMKRARQMSPLGTRSFREWARHALKGRSDLSPKLERIVQGRG